MLDRVRSEPGRPRTVRCAIYTRKSSEEGLEQDFNSLHAQREACEAYVRSQKHEGWIALEAAYDDGGYSGGTMDRPALQRLLSDVQSGHADVVVVYKVDRLTRALSDFARMVEVFDAAGVSFVSVTQQFNTTTSMGRLTLNVLLSFAQFEREVTGERIRDKIAASKKKGLWMGGFVPLGYEAKNRTLAINEEEAQSVRTLSRLYLELGCIRRVQEEAARLRLRTKPRTAGSGRMSGGKPFSRGHIYRILSNPLYVGEISHKGQCYPGQHEAIIDRATWDEVQAKLAGNGLERRIGRNASEPSLLAGLLFDEQGDPLTATHANKQGRRYRYYVSRPSEANGRGVAKPGWRVSAHEIEAAVLDVLRQTLCDPQRLTELLGIKRLAPDRHRAILEHAAALAVHLASGSVSEQREVLLALIRRINLAETVMEMEVQSDEILEAHGIAPEHLAEDDGVVTLRSPLMLKRRGGETKLVIEGISAAADSRKPDAALIKAMARGHAWFEELASGRACSIAEIAARERLSERYVARLLRLAFLAPATVEAILRSEQPVNMTAEGLTIGKELPLLWE